MWFEPKRNPDELIPPLEEQDNKGAYIRRWYVARKWTRLLENVYLHNVLRSDDDRALHDHPWWNVSIVLWGGYYEHMPVYPKAFKMGVNMATKRVWRGVGSIVFRRATDPHRLEIPAHPCNPTWTLFITGKKVRDWGFYCPERWVHNESFGENGCGR